MINVTLKGIDIYLAGEFDREIHSKLASLFHVRSEEIITTALESLVFHQGVDQTTYQLVIKFELPECYRQYEKVVADYVLSASQDFSVHTLCYFIYVKEENIYERIDEDYPRFMDEKNIVEYDENDSNEGEEQEIFTGNIFQNFDKHSEHKHHHCCDDESCDCEHDCDDDNCECDCKHH